MLHQKPITVTKLIIKVFTAAVQCLKSCANCSKYEFLKNKPWLLSWVREHWEGKRRMTVYSKKTILAYGADRLNFDAGGAGGKGDFRKKYPTHWFQGERILQGNTGRKTILHWK